MGKATRGAPENRGVLALLRSPLVPTPVSGAVPACCVAVDPRAGSAPCPTPPLKQWGPGPGALWNRNPPPRSGIRDRKVSQLNSCFLNNVFTLQTGKLYFFCHGQSICVVCKTPPFLHQRQNLLLQHRSVAAGTAFGWRAGLGEEAAGEGRRKVHILTRKPAAAPLMQLKTRTVGEIPPFLPVPCFPRPCWELIWDSSYWSCWQEGRESQRQLPSGAFPGLLAAAKYEHFFWCSEGRFRFRVQLSSCWEGICLYRKQFQLLFITRGARIPSSEAFGVLMFSIA